MASLNNFFAAVMVSTVACRPSEPRVLQAQPSLAAATTATARTREIPRTTSSPLSPALPASSSPAPAKAPLSPQAPESPLDCRPEGRFAGAAGAPEALFVLAGDFESAHTCWFERVESRLELVGRSSDVVIEWKGAVWQAVTEHHEQPATGCDSGLGGGPAVAALDHLILREVGGIGRVEPMGPAQPLTSDYESAVSSQIIGMFGSYLVVRHHDYSYTCGAHGGIVITIEVVDLAGGGGLSLLPRASVQQQARREALAYQKQSEFNGPPEAKWEATLPFYDGGRVRATYVFTTPTFYAVSSWTSYTHALFVEGPPPAAFASRSKSPALSLLASIKCNDAHLVGFTAAPRRSAATQAVRDLFGLNSPAHE